MGSFFRRGIAAFACLAGLNVSAAPYPTEVQLRTAIAEAATLLKPEGLELEMHDALSSGVTLPLMAAGLNLNTGTCVVFYNPTPEAGLNEFFAAISDKDLPVRLNAIAVHEATHCIEQREAYLRKRFDKVLPDSIDHEGMSVQGYLSVVKSGVTETWAEALADIVSVLYLKEVEPDRWRDFATDIAKMRHDTADKWPLHDTSVWLRKLIAVDAVRAPGQGLFEAAFQLRRELRPD